jgi:predicted metal-dependent phosphotriesterase family hydrolase
VTPKWLPIPPVWANYAGLIAEGHRDQVPMSIDYSRGFEENSLVENLYSVEGRTHVYLSTRVLDSLRRIGVSDQDMEHIMRENPRRVLQHG